MSSNTQDSVQLHVLRKTEQAMYYPFVQRMDISKSNWSIHNTHHQMIINCINPYAAYAVHCSVWCQCVTVVSGFRQSVPPPHLGFLPLNRQIRKAPCPLNGFWERCGVDYNPWMPFKWLLRNNTRTKANVKRTTAARKKRKLCTECTENQKSKKVMLGFQLHVADCSGSFRLPVSVARWRLGICTTGHIHTPQPASSWCPSPPNT